MERDLGGSNLVSQHCLYGKFLSLYKLGLLPPTCTMLSGMSLLISYTLTACTYLHIDRIYIYIYINSLQYINTYILVYSFLQLGGIPDLAVQTEKQVKVQIHQVWENENILFAMVNRNYPDIIISKGFHKLNLDFSGHVNIL